MKKFIFSTEGGSGQEGHGWRLLVRTGERLNLTLRASLQEFNVVFARSSLPVTLDLPWWGEVRKTAQGERLSLFH